MTSRLLRGTGVLAVQALPACSPVWAAVVLWQREEVSHLMRSKLCAGLEREIMMAARNDLDPYNLLPPKGAPGTKDKPNLVPSITDKQIVGCICEEDNSAVIWFWLHKGEVQCCPNCGAHYKLVPHQLSH